ncbi:MAG: four helix bundle protein [Gemmatimonadaceae bacterium]
MQDFKKLKVWMKAHSFVLDVYSTTKSFPTDERYGLTAQLRKSVVSVPTNLAEGCGRDSTGAFASFVQIATGSACEAEYQLLLARDLGYLKNDEHARLSQQVSHLERMLTSLDRTLVMKTAVRGERLGSY